MWNFNSGIDAWEGTYAEFNYTVQCERCEEAPYIHVCTCSNMAVLHERGILVHLKCHGYSLGALLEQQVACTY